MLPTFKQLATRKDIANILRCDIRTICNYHRLALKCVDDYLEGFPKVLNTPATNYRLNVYQQWCLWKLQQAIATIKNTDMIKESLKNDPSLQYQFSRQAFKEDYEDDVA
jgi:hypothetical protein